MEGLKQDIEQTVEVTKEYLETELSLIKVEVVEKVSKGFASALSRVILLSLLILPFFFGLVALGFYFSTLLDSYAGGFGVVSGGIALLYVIGVVLRRFLIVYPLQNYFISMLGDILFTEKDETDAG